MRIHYVYIFFDTFYRSTYYLHILIYISTYVLTYEALLHKTENRSLPLTMP